MPQKNIIENFLIKEYQKKNIDRGTFITLCESINSQEWKKVINWLR